MSAVPKLDLPTRVDLPAPLVDLIGPEIADELSALVLDEVRRHAAKIAATGFREGLVCGVGHFYAPLVIADQFGESEELNTEIAALPGKRRATVSRVLSQCRRNRGLPVRMPGNSRDGGWAARRAKGASKSISAKPTTP